jgi:hypothetical protein
MKIDIEGKEVDALTTATATTTTTDTPSDNYFSLYYRKVDNEDFFNSLETSQIQLRNTTNYIPIYESYFNMNETNYNSFNLNQRYYVSCLSGIVDRNNIQAGVIDTFKSKENSLMIEHKPIYIKFSPLLDPLKYLSGKYATATLDASASLENDVISIPKLSKILPLSGLPKVNDKNNSSYVDSFFSYLSSQLLNHHQFIHGLDFYGSFNGVKTDFYYNVIDDIDYLDKNPFFIKNKDALFTIEDEDYDYGENGSGSNSGSDNDDCISLDSMGKVKPRNNTRNRRVKIKVVNGGDVSGVGGSAGSGVSGGAGSGAGDDISDNQYIIHDDFNTINNELNAVFATTTHTCDSVCLTDLNLDSMMMLNDLGENNNSAITDSNIHLKAYHSDSDNDSNAISDMDNYVEHSGGSTGVLDDGIDDDSCSSRSSYTSCSDSDGGDGVDVTDKREKGEKGEKNIKEKYNKNDDVSESGESGESDEGDEDADYYDEDETLWSVIKDFPVSAIMLEKCDNTLDSLMMGEEEMSDDEWKSALMQVIMTLITYQKVFGFTHNDLHTNNVMFVHTDKTYVYYLFNKKYYRVPTYHRIFKIIDFGRAIYKYKGRVICSDSFSATGDAATQYNIEPYFNDKKPRLEPNFSFDLSRLGCSIFDYFIDNMGDVAKVCKSNPIAKLIVEWVTDDQNRNILYKTNGEERYPDFKLYKMIARSVHKHTPQAQLAKPMFIDYEVPKKKIKPTNRIVNIDKLPSYTD